MNWLVDLILKLVALFLGQKPAAVTEAEGKGAAEQQVIDLQKDASDAQKAVQAADASRAATADPGQLRAPDSWERP